MTKEARPRRLWRNLILLLSAAAGRCRRPVFLVGAILAFPFVCGMLFFAFHAATRHGVAFGISVGTLVVSVLAIVRGVRNQRHPRCWRITWLSAAGIAIAFFLVSLGLSPPGKGGDAQLRVEHVFSSSEGVFPRYSLGNVVSEWDQVAAGIALARWWDPLIDAEQASRIQKLSFPLYTSMTEDEAFASMGSVLTWAYSDLCGGSFHSGHYVALAPRPGEVQREESIVFLHGSAGNFSCYWYALSPLVRERGFTVICPSFGFGNWHMSGGTDAIHAAASHSVTHFGLERDRLYLVALSSAGRGATRFVARHPGFFRGVVFVSALLNDESLEQSTETDAWRDVPVLLLHGADDRRVPLRHAEGNIADLRRRGAQVAPEIIEGEDHFLWFSSRSTVLQSVSDWIQTSR